MTGLSLAIHLNGQNFTMDNGSTLNFYSSTWEWSNHKMYDTEEVLRSYTFKGNYTHLGQVATMISTHYRLPEDSDWVEWQGQWTATLQENNRIYVNYDGAVNSRMLLQEGFLNIQGGVLK